MEKYAVLRSIWRKTSIRSARHSSISERQLCNGVRHYTTHLQSQPRRNIFSPSVTNGFSSACRLPIATDLSSIRTFSVGVSHMPAISDPDIENVFKDLMAASWDELPQPVIHDAKNALTKSTDDKAGQEVLTNVFRAAEAVEKFSGILISLKMELDDLIGLSGENVKPLSDDFVNALRVAHQRYVTYLGSFGPEETYLRKKVEHELGSKMIYLKMRCSGLGPEWGEVSVHGTSGLSGSYVEQRG